MVQFNISLGTEDPLSVGINDLIRVQILGFVGSVVPAGATEFWLTGSRAVGTHCRDSDRDVVAFHPDAPQDSKKLFCSNQVKEIEPGFLVELVIAHPDHKDDPRLYMTDLRKFGIRLR